jgi:hypothetical protein
MSAGGVAWLAAQRPLFSPEENRASEQEDAKRLYKRVRHAADQLKISARNAAPKDRAHGVLFLDRDGNNYLVNLADTIRGWMGHPWAKPIDLIMWFDYRPRENKWGTLAKAMYSRTGRALHAFACVYEPCTQAYSTRM